MDLKLENQQSSLLKGIANMPDGNNVELPWPVQRKRPVITTREKLEGYNIVKAILREIIDISRITYRDTLSYFVVQLDGTSRKTICRLYLDNRKYFAVLNEDKSITRHRMSNIDELYRFAYIIRPLVLKMEEE